MRSLSVVVSLFDCTFAADPEPGMAKLEFGWRY